MIKDRVAAAVARVKEGAVDDLADGFERPVIIHRAILGSVERMLAVLIEHTEGKWPMWLSPRQVAVVPVALSFASYASEVGAIFHAAGFYTDVDLTHDTMNKKVRNAQLAQYNFIFVVGEVEANTRSVNIRTRDKVVHGTKSLEETLAMLRGLVADYK